MRTAPKPADDMEAMMLNELFDGPSPAPTMTDNLNHDRMNAAEAKRARKAAARKAAL